MKILKILGAALLLGYIQQAAGMDNFDLAKKNLPGIFRQLENPATLYCNCPLTFHANRYSTDIRECGYKVRKNAKRAARIEAEHIMPAWEFGHQLGCWKSGKRKQCSAGDEKFQRMEGDLHNLWPAIGEVNGDRSNFGYSQWGTKSGMYGQCPVVIDFKLKRIQPAEFSRGPIARAYLYMSEQYHIRLSKTNRRMFETWNKMYPPSADECRRDQAIELVQGNSNHFVRDACSL